MADILIIDDEPMVRDLFRKVLEAAGYSVAATASAREGLRLLRDRSFDLVLTDIWMPDMDGLEVTRTLRRDFPRIKIIAMSGGQQDVDYCSVARHLGAHASLLKPIALRRLLDTVAHLLAPSRGEPV